MVYIPSKVFGYLTSFAEGSQAHFLYVQDSLPMLRVTSAALATHDNSVATCEQASPSLQIQHSMNFLFNILTYPAMHVQ